MTDWPAQPRRARRVTVPIAILIGAGLAGTIRVRAERRATSPQSRPAVSPHQVPAASAVLSDTDALADLRSRHLRIPVEGVQPAALGDTFTVPRAAGNQHEALDILAPRHTPVVAVERGTIEKLFTSVRGGLTVYEFDPTRTYAYYYAHLQGYAPGLREHATVERGQVLGFVGTTGDAPKNVPHLHFAIFVLTPARHWWQGRALDPYDVWR